MRRILVANRGEIALRVIRACQELGIETVAVYTEVDRAARHVELADHAFNLRTDTYLSAGKLLELAVRAGADGVHPGYGFLSENAEFARACVARGIAWIGPNPDAISRMGSKTEARRAAGEAGVEAVPGTVDACTDPQEIVAFGKEYGWPVAIKAAAGGGGRGFVVVNGPDESEAGLSRARREGEAYFASGECYLEKYLPRPRHIEVQILGDKYGSVIHLGERECSIQRRHQKLVEECPSPAITPELREAMGAAAVKLAKAVAYDSAGTVEFLFSDGRFYFLEMNTRIQVEHTITELVYRCDLVKEQIRIAAGAPLRKDLAGRKPEGWAIECRINAEDPAQNFRPAPGLLTRVRKPGGPGVRIDDAVYNGYRIPDQYDSLLAKLVAWGEDRDEAIARMRRALREVVLEGVPTTVPFHLLVMDHPAFRAGDTSTRFVGEAVSQADLAKLAMPADSPKDAALPAAPGPAAEGPGPFRTFEVEVDDQRYQVRIAEVGAAPAPAASTTRPRKPVAASSAGSGAGTNGGANGGGTVKAPMHATVQRVLVEVGKQVEAGQTLLVLEAMKMETEIPCPVAGTVQELAVTAGQTVEGGMILAVVRP
ncbi:MAG: carbamoyl phosphate synthase [Candidatus Sericytochromatia bacterium]|nr:carbamoyl phosphate synthase [Candidatus Tanganyikabacteria bacterium]